MKTVILGVANQEDASRRFVRAMESGEASGNYITFETPTDLWKTITAKRWELLASMIGAGPLSIREASRRVERDVKAVHRDVRALLNCGILSKTENGLIIFPFDRVHVAFELIAA